MQKTIHKKRIFHGVSIETLWLALTESKQLEEWFMETNFQAKENLAFEFFDSPGKKWKGLYYGEIISNQPIMNIAYTWCHKKLKHTTYVWWKLESKGQDTILELEHSGFKGFMDYYYSFSYSRFWNDKLKNLLLYVSRMQDKVEI